MTRWFATDRDGFMAVFESGDTGAVPQAVADPERGDELTTALSRQLRRDMTPVAGSHADVRAGTVLMLADANRVRSWADHVETLGVGAIVARFPKAPRGRPATFMANVRTFGSGDDSPSAFELAHGQGLCRGCSIDRSDDEIDEKRLADLGFYVFVCDDTSLAAPYRRTVVPAEPLHCERIGSLVRRFAKFPGKFAALQQLQPIEHWKKIVVEAAAWLGTDGKVRCVTGRSYEYAEEYKFLVGEYPNVEPPA
ncbi:MAG TPA: hypothetical protein VIV40_19135 [Kofleriaceae bacterium]